MSTTSKFDPLESAKITDAVRASDDAALASGKRAGRRGPEHINAAPEDAPAPAPSAPPVPVAPRAPRTVFRVTAECKASFNGCVSILKVGTILDPAGYGGIEKLEARKAEGLPLEKIEV